MIVFTEIYGSNLARSVHMDNSEHKTLWYRLLSRLKRIPRRQYLFALGVLGVFVIALVGAMLVFLSKREAMLASAIERGQDKLAHDYDVELVIGRAYFSGLNKVNVETVALVPQERESLLDLETASVSVRIWPLLTGKIKLGTVYANDIVLTLIKQDSISNYDFIFRERETDIEKGKLAKAETQEMSARANALLSRLLGMIPRDMDIRDLSVHYTDDSTHQHLHVPTVDMRNGSLESVVSLNERKAWQVSGKLYPDRRQLSFKIHANGDAVDVPLLKSKYGLEMAFDTVEAQLSDITFRNKELHIVGQWAVHDLKVNHWRIAQQQVVVPQVVIDAEFVVGENFIELSEKSNIRVNNLNIMPHFRYTRYPEATYDFRLRTPEMEAQGLFDAIPKGLFESLEDVQVSGRIQFDMSVFLDSTRPDSVQFSANMQQDDFQVETWGQADFPKINKVFTYTPYEKGEPVRDIIVGPQNPNFIRLHEISPHLRNAVLTTEDPSFFSHQGFVEDAFRTSIAINYKEKAFRRGGSTISMQLVKNVFLNRNKTMARKIEEIIIVWLMESTGVVSKERMLEVYLNIIEWGHNVYGISEAARYYFAKHPSQLSVGESIYLASIVPRPKTGRYGFVHDGSLKPYLSGYFGYIGNIMARRGLIDNESDQLYGFYNVSLREALRPPKPEGIDTSRIRPPEMMRMPENIEDSRMLLQRVFGELGSDN